MAREAKAVISTWMPLPRRSRGGADWRSSGIRLLVGKCSFRGSLRRSWGGLHRTAAFGDPRDGIESEAKRLMEEVGVRYAGYHGDDQPMSS